MRDSEPSDSYAVATIPKKVVNCDGRTYHYFVYYMYQVHPPMRKNVKVEVREVKTKGTNECK